VTTPSRPVCVAVVGHVEWVIFARVQRVPLAGEILHPEETWEEPAGGGAVAAVQLAKLAGEATLFTSLGDDELGHRAHRELQDHGVRVEADFRDVRQRRAFTFIDENGERTITTLGERHGPRRSDPLPWEELAATDAVYFTAGDDGALEAARQAGVVVATARELRSLARARVAVDALVGSRRDPWEEYTRGDLKPPPRFAVRTAGADGGSYETADGRRGTFAAAPLPGPRVDAYGCGDSFAAGLTFGLGAGLDLDEALAMGARCGAACLTGRGPYRGQLRLAAERPRTTGSL
jgi:ribokinase